MFLRSPILPRNGRKIPTLLYARYSTEEQDASSIPDQDAYCERFLSEAKVKDTVLDKIADPEMSGELVSRPGIDRVRQGIANRQWDLIVCEDSSRLFRNVAPCLELVGSAVDNGIRVIAINDDVDTCDTEHWEERLTDALNHHARSNRFTSQRIKRKLEALWKMGAAVGPVKVGYKRQPSIPARMGEPAKGPFFDEIDAKWTSIIREAYERILRGEQAWTVADWLTEVGLPKSTNQKKREWQDYNVVDLIQRPDYRGFQEYRNTVSEKHHGSGKRPQRKNPDPDKVLNRDMPQLRIIPDWLWFGANTVIDERDGGKGSRASGLDHPLAGIPRDSRGPLSKIFFCGMCGAKMHQDGRGGGGYRCSAVRNRRDPCWNKATAARTLVHENLSKAIVAQLLSSREHVDILLDLISHRVEQDSSLDLQLKKARAEEATQLVARDRLLAAIEMQDDGPLDILVERLALREKTLASARAKREELEQAESADQQSSVVSRPQLEAAFDLAAERLLTMDRETAALLQHIVPRIEAVPYRQFQSNRVVLRARFQLQFVNLLPQQLSALLRGDSQNEDSADVLRVPMCVDLFDPSNGPKHGLKAVDLKAQGLTLVEIGRELGISKRSAHIAAEYGKAMIEADIVDPFIELTEPPINASRWR